MRKLTKSKMDELTLENINSSCACVEYCSDEGYMRDYYKNIQAHTARTGDESPFVAEKNI